MTGVELLLDTNAIIAWTKYDLGLLRLLDRSGRAAITLPTLGELHYGARKSQRVVDNLASIDELLAEFEVVLPDQATAAHYGSLKNRLRGKARPIPENDLWIAAIAFQHGLPLATRDTHFQVVDGIRLLHW